LTIAAYISCKLIAACLLKAMSAGRLRFANGGPPKLSSTTAFAWGGFFDALPDVLLRGFQQARMLDRGHSIVRRRKREDKLR
jgi:hypothetical protein